MAKAHRSPLLGYNHNIGHLGRVFHVQTEDSGPISPRVFTHLFHEGIILVSRKVEYETMLADDKVRVLMQTQHRALIKELAGGAFNERIIAFFRARGVDLSAAVATPVAAGAAVIASGAAAAAIGGAPAVPGAVPSAPIMGDGSAEPAVPAPAAAAPPVVVPVAPVPAPAAPPRRNTRPIETGRSRKPTPPPVTVRPPDSRRPPFVRSGAPAVAKTASADGVVVQRSVVVGGSSTGEGRPRIRPPVPYIVTGGSHPVRPAAAPTAPTTSKAAATGTVTVGAAAATAVVAAGEAKVQGAVPSPGLGGADAPARTGVFGPPVPDDKSLDEVILEYLSEDGE